MANKKGTPKNLIQGNPNATGRPPDWLKAQCQKIFERSKLQEFLEQVAVGGDVERFVTIDGRQIQIAAGTKDRLRATELLKEWGFGKEDESRRINLQFILDFSQKVVMVLGKTVPDNCPHCKQYLGLRDDTIRELDQLSQSQNLEMEVIKR